MVEKTKEETEDALEKHDNHYIKCSLCDKAYTVMTRFSMRNYNLHFCNECVRDLKEYFDRVVLK